MTKHHYNIKLDIPQDADSARYFIPKGYIARFEDGVLIVEPEESEDEMIRSALLRGFNSMLANQLVETFYGEPIRDIIAYLERQKDSPMPEDTVIFQKGVEEGRRLEREEQKPEWGEEDEIYLQDALWCVKQASKIARGENDMGACWSAERWLNSLKNRGNSPKSNTNSPWKPSAEQMRQLGYVAEQNKHNMLGKELMTLYNDLEKLM